MTPLLGRQIKRRKREVASDFLREEGKSTKASVCVCDLLLASGGNRKIGSRKRKSSILRRKRLSTPKLLGGRCPFRFFGTTLFVSSVFKQFSLSDRRKRGKQLWPALAFFPVRRRRPWPNNETGREDIAAAKKFSSIAIFGAVPPLADWTDGKGEQSVRTFLFFRFRFLHSHLGEEVTD